MRRCGWVDSDDDLMVSYHDQEWGVPVRDDQKLFECLMLEMFQSGLSWSTILNKRENFRSAFDNFLPDKVARYNDEDVERLVLDSGIVRHRKKIQSVITNARVVVGNWKERGSFTDYVWGFVGNAPIRHTVRTVADDQSTSNEATFMSNDFKGRGFVFLGPTTCYAFMQASGLVNDHEDGCFCCADH